MEITVKGNEFKFDPSNITLKVGQRVRLTFVNTGTVDHELEVDGMKSDNVQLDLTKAGNIPQEEGEEAKSDASNGEVHAYAAANGTAVVEFTPTQTGTFSFSCNLPGHKEAGMVGQFVVQP